MTDPAVAVHAVPDRSPRRALLGAGLAGAALAITGARSASASSSPGLSEADKQLASFAIALELTARDLYEAAIAAGSAGDAWGVMRDQHSAYATRIAGLAGISADSRNDEVYTALVSSFGTSDPFAAAVDLENTAAATHTELLGRIEDVGYAEITAAIAAMESRHSTVLGLLAGETGDSLFINSADPLEA